jgi:hypothetical protein
MYPPCSIDCPASVTIFFDHTVATPALLTLLWMCHSWHYRHSGRNVTGLRRQIVTSGRLNQEINDSRKHRRRHGSFGVPPPHCDTLRDRQRLGRAPRVCPSPGLTSQESAVCCPIVFVLLCQNSLGLSARQWMFHVVAGGTRKLPGLSSLQDHLLA